MRKRIVSLLLAMALILSMIPTNRIVTTAMATSTNGSTAKVIIEETWGNPDGTATVDVSIEDNPGILGATLIVSWDDRMELVSYTSGEVFEDYTLDKPSQHLSEGTNFSWYRNSVDKIIDGTMITFTFQISADVVENEKLHVNISYVPDEVMGKDGEDVNLTIEPGHVRVITYKPGDVTGDKKINLRDLTRLSQYISDKCTTNPAGYNAVVVENACDVTGDGKINIRDIVRLSQFISDGCKTVPDGYNARLYPAKDPGCTHAMEKVPYTPATCETDGTYPHYHCSKCNLNFNDEKGSKEMTTIVEPAKGHTEVDMERVEPTYETPGSEGGKKCSVCGKTTVEPTEIPVLEKTTVNIEYHYEGKSAGAFLQDYVNKNDLSKFNPNQKEYNTAKQGYSLDPLTNVNAVPGYEFVCWVDGYGNPVTSISKGEAKNLILYAKWDIQTYWITFDCGGNNAPKAVNIPDYAGMGMTNFPLDSIHYTVETRVPLSNYSPKLFQHTFVGWSTDDGFLIDEVPLGTTGNFTVHANWTANRNRATSYESYGEPIIIEDDVRGQIFFVYKIGRIDNVPLNKGQYLGYLEKLDETKTYETHTYMSQEDITRINEMISQATTQSSGWTLSEEWNELYGKAENTGTLLEKSQERTDSSGKTVGGEYFVSNSKGGSSHVSNESGGSWSNSSKITTDDSWGLNSSEDINTEMYCDAQLGFKNETTLSAGVEAPVGIAKVSAGVENTTTIEAGIQNGRKDNYSYHTDSSESHYVGTVDSAEASGYYNSTASSSSNWNSTSGYTSSNSIHEETKLTDELKEQIRKDTTINVETSTGGTSENTYSKANTDTKESEYGTSIAIAQGTEDTVKTEKHWIGTNEGHYRVVPMGIFHVYGIVGYDIATGSYFTHCFNVQDDTVSVQLDYSRNNATFDDCENGVVTFEVPYDIAEYVNGFVGKTNGLVINDEGEVTGFEIAHSDVAYFDEQKNGYAVKTFDGTIVVPMYEGKDDGSGIAVKVTSFSSDAFNEVKDTLETLVLPIYVTEIPDHAFEGFTKLKTVIAYGVTKIGDYAFAGCTSLESFNIDTAITHLGENAFIGVKEISVAAYNTKVAMAAIKSGAKSITLNIGYMKDEFTDLSFADGKRELVIDTYVTHEDRIVPAPEYFELNGGGKTFDNMKIKSTAAETVISNMTFVNNVSTPIELESEKVALSRVKVVDSPAFALILKKDADVRLLGDVSLTTTSGNTVLSRSASFSKAVQGTTSRVLVNGKYLVCGEVTNKNFIYDYNDQGKNVEPTVITEDEYEKYLSSCIISFHPNGGSVDIQEKTVYYQQAYGELPVPTRTGWTFAGWFTEATGGTQVKEEDKVENLVAQTLYAHWNAMAYNASWNGGEGYTITVTRTESPYAGAATGVLNSGAEVFYGDKLSITYTRTDYYEIVSNGDTEITVAGNITSDQIHATAKLKDVKDWVLASEMPSDAELINQKWSYTLTTKTESREPSLAGFTQTGSYWVQSGSGSQNYASFPGGFKSDHWIYTSFAKSQPYYANETETTKREVSTSWSGYVYWHWMYNVHYANNLGRVIAEVKGTGKSNGFGYSYFYALTSTTNCGRASQGYVDGYSNSKAPATYNCHSILPASTGSTDGMGTPRFFRFDYYTCHYTDYYKMFQYMKQENLESASEVYASDTISNVQKWVQYREK